MTRAIVHPDYDFPNDFSFDFGLVKAEKAVFDPMKIISICDQMLNLTDHEAKIVTIGWGKQNVFQSGNNNDDLLELSISIHKDSVCEENFQENYNHEIMICAGSQGKTTCAGDSGSPLLYEKKESFCQIGITSYGHLYCEGTATFAKVWSVKEWIYDTTKG